MRQYSSSSSGSSQSHRPSTVIQMKTSLSLTPYPHIFRYVLGSFSIGASMPTDHRYLMGSRCCRGRGTELESRLQVSDDGRKGWAYMRWQWYRRGSCHE